MRSPRRVRVRDAGGVTERNVLGEDLEPCGTDPITGFYRDGCCNTGPEDLGSHTVCAVVTAEFLEHQRSIGNDLSTPMPHYHFPGLSPVRDAAERETPTEPIRSDTPAGREKSPRKPPEPRSWWRRMLGGS